MPKKSLTSFAVAAAIAFIAGCAQAPPPPPPAQDFAADEAKLKADALAWFDLYGKGDAEGLAKLYAEDALLMPPGAAAVTGRSGIQAFLAVDAAKAKTAGVAVKNSAVTGAAVQGDMGWISGNYTVVDGSGAVVDSGSYLSVHKRANGNWLYIRDIWNSDRPAAPAAPAPK